MENFEDRSVTELSRQKRPLRFEHPRIMENILAAGHVKYIDLVYIHADHLRWSGVNVALRFPGEFFNENGLHCNYHYRTRKTLGLLG